MGLKEISSLVALFIREVNIKIIKPRCLPLTKIDKAARISQKAPGNGLNLEESLKI
jgi:hypothetical protein